MTDSVDWSQLDMTKLSFLKDGQPSDHDYGLIDELPPPGTKTSSLVVDVDPDVLDELVHEATASGRTVSEVVQARLRRSAA